MTNYNRERNLLTDDLKKTEGLIEKLSEFKLVCAGGAITSIFSGNPIRDYDLYYTDESKIEDAMGYFNSIAHMELETDRAATFVRFVKEKKHRFQLIKIPETMGGTENIFKRFDFTICMGAYDFASAEFILHEDFLKHLSQRRLVFNHMTLYPINSLIRTKKYVARGFLISNVELLKIGLTIANLRMLTLDDLRAQMEGIDTLFLKELTDGFTARAGEEYKFDEVMETIETFLCDKLGSSPDWEE